MSLADPISIRLPADLKKQLEDYAHEKKRSLNAEIRMRLKWSFEAGFDGEPTDAMLANEVESLRGELRGSIRNLQAEIATLKAEIAALKKRTS